MSLKFDFAQKNVVVTGGARGIGLEISRQFLEAGASVVIWEHSEECIANAKTDLSRFPRVHFRKVDVSKTDSCESAAGSLPFENGRVDILVNNAGVTRDKSFAKMTDEDFEAVIATNLSGVFRVTKSLLNKFSAEGKLSSGAGPHKRIISISSIVALYGNFGQTNYVAAKAGVIGMTKTWARELGPKGFTANAIAPGFIRTPMVELMPSDVLAGMAEKIPAKRLGETADIANACLFLASDEASYINGAVLSVDGGLVG